MTRATLTVVPGDKVKLTGVYLRNTGQIAGGEGRKTWRVVACTCDLCARGGFAAVDEPPLDYGQWDDLPEAERPKHRHINLGNLQRVGAPPRAKDFP